MGRGTARLATAMTKEDMKIAAVLQVSPILESEVAHQIPPHGTVRGWVALDSLRHAGLSPGQIYFRIKLRDAANRGGTYVTELPRTQPGDSSMNVNNGVIQVAGMQTDISGFHVKYYGDPFPTTERTPKEGAKKNNVMSTAKTEPEKGNKEIAPSTSPSTAQSGSISQSNSGGINVQQGTTGNNSPILNSPITVGDVPKSISPQDMSALISYFSNAKNKAKVKVSADQISGAAPFPGDFYSALKAGGWTMLEEGVNQYIGFAAPGKRFQGAVVTVRGEPLGPNETVYFEAFDSTAYVGAALEAFKIPRTLKRDKNQEEGVITIDFQGGFPHP
jgi:hypothetical protein